MIVFDLVPRGPLHVGESVGIDREAVHEHIPSDTVFGACVSTWRARLGADELSRRLAAMLADPAVLKLTSAFPRLGPVRLCPMPLGIRLNIKREDALDGKQRKRIAWVSEGIFEATTQGRPVDAWLAPACFHQGGAVWLRPEDVTIARTALAQPAGELRGWVEQIVPRVTVDRSSSASNLFHSGRVTFAPAAGLWLAATGTGAAWVTEALQTLQDGGIGGLRSTGHGAFAFSAHQLPDWKISTSGYGVTFARFAPADARDITEALQPDLSAYQVTEVGGWCVDEHGKAWKRRKLRMIVEGSVLGARARGALVDVRPADVVAHPVYRYGVPLLRAVRQEVLA